MSDRKKIKNRELNITKSGKKLMENWNKIRRRAGIVTGVIGGLKDAISKKGTLAQRA